MAKKILMVGRYNWKGYLEELGYSVVGSAKNGAGGIVLARDSGMQKPHLALIEYDLPDMNGLELAEKIMQFRPSIAVLLYGVDVEAPDHHEIETRARALGVSCVVRYPCAEKEFANALETALKGSLFSKPAFQVFGGISGDFVSPAARRRQSVPTERRTSENGILLADSSPVLQQVMRDGLWKAGYDIVGAAKTEQECLEMIREHRPAMVILDYMEEKDNRLGFIGRIRDIDSAICIMLRIDKDKYPNTEKMKDLALRAGASGVVFTPIHPQRLLNEAKRLIGSPAARRGPSRILLVDSSPFLQKMMGDVLGREGYEIIGNAKTAEECLEMVWEHRPDLVILDFMEEKDHRLGFITMIHAIDSDVPIVLRIDRNKYPNIKEMTERGIRAGAAGVFFSPFVNERLLEEVKRVLG